MNPLEIINIPYTQGDKIYICAYIREHDENLLNIIFDMLFKAINGEWIYSNMEYKQYKLPIIEN